MKTIFNRKLKDGAVLTCFVDNNGFPNNIPAANFAVSGKLIKSKYFGKIKTLNELETDLKLCPNNKHTANIITMLKENNYDGIWEYKIPLYSSEIDAIKSALASAKAEKTANELKTLNATDIIVTEKVYDGTPKKAENDFFTWYFLSPDYLVCKKTGKIIYQMSYLRSNGGSDAIIDTQVKDKVLKFWDELALITKHAEEKYETAETCALKLPNHLEGLTFKEIKEKEKVYDDVMNEGEEGFNPYRDYCLTAE